MGHQFNIAANGRGYVQKVKDVPFYEVIPCVDPTFCFQYYAFNTYLGTKILLGKIVFVPFSRSERIEKSIKSQLYMEVTKWNKRR